MKLKLRKTQIIILLLVLLITIQKFLVVIDRRRDPKADTGCFEQIYKQNLPNQNPAYLGMTLSIRGKKIFKKRSSNTKRSEKKDTLEHKHRSSKTPKPKLQLDMIKNYNGPVIGNLIEELQESLFKTTMQTMDEMTVPPAPQVSLVNTLPLTHQRPVGVSDLTPVQRATVSFSCKQRSKTNFFHSTKSNGAKEKNRKKSNTRVQRTKLPSTPTQSLSLYSKWKQGLESKSAKSSSDKPKWEKDTASILNNKSDILPKPKLVNSCIVSSIARILPEIDTKNTTAPFCQNLNLFTVGLGYKNLCYKPVVKENIILPVNNQPNVDGCCVKL